MRSRVMLVGFLSVGAVMCSGFTAAEELQRPRRRPDGGAYLTVTLSVPSSSLQIKSGSQANFSGTIWLERLVGKKLRGATSLTVEDTSGGKVKLPDIDLQIDADLDPAGEQEALQAESLPDDLVFRALASSDFGLLPLRLLVPHQMGYESGSKEATKEVEVPGATVGMYETNLGTRRLRGTMGDVYFTRTVRRFKPSGFQIHDFVLTCHDPSEGVVMYGTGLRLLVHPTRRLPNGEQPRAGVFHIAQFHAMQLEWLSSDEYLDDKERSGLDDKFRFGLENALYDALKVEGVGNPFESPAAFALEYANLLDERAVQRLINLKNPKILAMTAPTLVDSGISFDPASHLKFWRKADDPVERLLLAAGAAAGGAKEEAFVEEANIAVRSKDREILKAVKVLARALNDPLLAKEADRALGN